MAEFMAIIMIFGFISKNSRIYARSIKNETCET